MRNQSKYDGLDIDVYDEEDEDTQKDKFLTFHLNKEVYGIEIIHVIEIVGLQEITEVPDMPDYVKGVINLRGQVIPLIDVRVRFKMEPQPYHDRTCVIVVKVNESMIGLVVDSVKEVSTIPESQITPPPMIGKTVSSRYIKGMGKSGDCVTIILDINRLLFDHELTSLPQGCQSDKK